MSVELFRLHLRLVERKGSSLAHELPSAMAKPNSARRKGDGEFVEVKRSSGVRTSRKVGGKSHTDVAKSKSLVSPKICSYLSVY